MDSNPATGLSPPRAPTPGSSELQLQTGVPPIPAKIKERQSAKIRELAKALQNSGFYTLDEQAKALGLSRSTAWTVRRANHKASGLSASIINRMLATPHLPSLVRSKILEYVEEKAAGLYGGSRAQRRTFIARISLEGARALCEQNGQPEIAKRIDPSAQLVRSNQSLETKRDERTRQGVENLKRDTNVLSALKRSAFSSAS
jgi:hypothetical protein